MRQSGNGGVTMSQLGDAAGFVAAATENSAAPHPPLMNNDEEIIRRIPLAHASIAACGERARALHSDL